MELKKAIKILDEHNKWRRDRSLVNKYEMQNPTELGIAIDVILDELKKQ